MSDPNAAPPPTPVLSYEAGLSRERLEDGSLRITVVSDRRRGMYAAIFCIVLSGSIGGSGYFLLPSSRSRMLYLLIGIMAVGGGLIFLLVVLLGEKQTTSVFEAGSFGIRVESTIAGDRVRKSFARQDIAAVRYEDGQLLIVSRGQDFPYLSFEKPGVIEDVAKALRETIAEA